MPVENRIVKVQKRNRALVRFDADRIRNAILRAGNAIGGFHQDQVPGVNDRLFVGEPDNSTVADALAEAVLLCLNADPHHLIANFPPTIEAIQDEVLHVLRSHGLLRTADAYACYRWSRHWLREGNIAPRQFIGNRLDSERHRAALAWNEQHQCHTQTGLNEIVRSGRLGGLITAALDHYETTLQGVSEQIAARCSGTDRVRLVWIAGPSSSGKTTTTVKLTRQLEQRGLRFLMLNLDDYFWPLVEHPTDWINDRNYETPEALDIQLINQHLRELLAGETIQTPIYNFREGRRTGTRPVRLAKDQILLLDCLHGLYPPLTEGIDGRAEFRIFVDAASPIFEGDGSSQRLISDTDIRMCRRMLRDARHRNMSTLLTLLHWHYVRAGELFSILPLEGRADAVINGGFPFDIPLMRPLLSGENGALPSPEALRDYPGFLDARIRLHRVQSLLEGAEGVPVDQLDNLDFIPGDAVVREFIGGSTVAVPHND